MTIEEVIDLIEDISGKRVDPNTNLGDLGMDSLDFVDLLLRFPNIPDEKVPLLHTVNDLLLAQNGEL